MGEERSHHGVETTRNDNAGLPNATGSGCYLELIERTLLQTLVEPT